MDETTPSPTPAPPTTSETAMPAAVGPSSPAAMGPDFMSFVPLIAIFAVFYFLIIRPQQKRLKEHQTMMSSLKKGDRVVTGGGIVATVVHAPEGAAEITVDLNDTTRVSLIRSTIANVIQPEVANDDGKKSASKSA